MSNYIVLMKTNHIISLISKIRDKANRLIVHELKVRNIHKLAPSHGDILMLLFQLGRVPMRKIAGRIGRDKSTVTALIKQLIDMGYVERRKDPTDSRITIIKLTRAGNDLKQGFDEISEILLEKVYRGFSEKEKGVIIDGMEKINRNF